MSSLKRANAILNALVGAGPLVGGSSFAFPFIGTLIAYYFMWYPGQPAAEQCEGCTLYTTQIGDLAYLHEHDVTYATLSRHCWSNGASARVAVPDRRSLGA